MTLLQKQSYNLWFNHIAETVIKWRDKKPANKDLRNFVKGMNEIGQYVNQLNMENDVLVKRVGMIRADKNSTITELQEQIEVLQNKLKQYEI
jgi:chaperonin cofactor prefoldin